MSSCVIAPKVLNKKTNEYVDSNLFRDLLIFTENDRTNTLDYYNIATDPETKKELGTRARYDENDELKLESFLSYAKLNVTEEKMLRTLNTVIGGNKLYEYDEAIQKLITFNRDHINGKYMATIEYTNTNNDGKNIILKVVKRTSKAEKNLEKLIFDNDLAKILSYKLGQLGFDVTMFDDVGSIKGISIQDVIKNVTYLKHGSTKEINEEMANQIADLISNLMDNDVLYKRLYDSITDEYAKEVLGDQYNYVIDQQKEVAKRLIANKLLNFDANVKTPNLVQRIIDTIKRKFSKLTDFEKDVQNTIDKTDEYVNSFMHSNISVSYEKQLGVDRKENYKEDAINIKTFKKIAALLDKQAKQMKIIDEKMGAKFKVLSTIVTAGRLADRDTDFTGHAIKEGIMESVKIMVETLPEMAMLMDDVKLSQLDYSSEDYWEKAQQYSKNLRTVRTFAITALELQTMIADVTSQDITNNMLKFFEEDQMAILRRTNNTLSEMVTKIVSAMDIKEREVLANIYAGPFGLGEDFVERGMRVLFKRKTNKMSDENYKKLKWYQKIKHISSFELVRQDASKEKISDMLLNLQDDISGFETILSSMSNSSDILHGIVDKMAKLANKKADDNTNQIWEALRMMEKNMGDAGIKNPREIFEVSTRSGSPVLTGNIVSELHWGDWEEDYQAMKNEKRKEFLSDPSLRNKTETEKAFLWNAFFKPASVAFHKTNSTYDFDLQMWTPSANRYTNEDYIRSIKNTDKESWIKQYLVLKWEIDKVLPQGAMRKYRAPQFKGRTVHQIKNRHMEDGITKSTLHTVRAKTRDLFVEDSEDYEFGSLSQYSNIDEDMFKNEVAFEQDKMKRLPLYGINKLKDINELSTDIFHSTLAYASMAYTYQQMGSLVDMMEIGTTVFKNRKVEGVIEKNREFTSKSYKRYIQFLDNNIYQIGVEKPKYDSKGIIVKVSGLLSSLAGKLYLGGNVLGGAVNVMQGATEIFKEALGGEYYNLKDLREAQKKYIKYLPENMMEAGKELKTNKMSLMIRHFNMDQQSKEHQRNFHPSKWRLQRMNPVGDNLFLPYKLGEHYMQTITFLALMEKIEVEDKNGKTMKLFDAYYVEEAFPPTKDNPNPPLVLKLTEGVTIKNKIKSKSQNIEYKGESSLMQELRERKRIEDENKNRKRLWTQADESALMDKGREINNRLHGIYNKQDRVGLQRTWWGKMILTMRGYALGMVVRRFGVNKYSVALGKDVEGNVITVSKVIADTFTNKDAMSIMATAGLLLWPFTVKQEQMMIDAGFSANQYANMRRNWGDLFVITAMFILKLLLAKREGDDDDDDDELGSGPDIAGIAYYFASRLASEQSAYSTPWGAYKEIPVVSKISPVGLSAATDFARIIQLSITQEEDSQGRSKAAKKIERLIPYYKSWLILQDPYKAAQSYQYGRTMYVK